MGTIQDKIDYLDETKQLIKEAIIEKNVPVGDNDTFRSYADKISNITGIDTSDATATANDIIASKTAYVDGEKITGTIPIQEQVITPTTQRQNIATGYHSNSYVEGVTAAIDSNIKSSNIKSGVVILGIEGNVEPDKPDQTKTVNPSTQQQIVEPDIGYELASVTVNPMQLESKTVTPSILPQVINPGTGKDGINQINVNAVDNTIDSNIQSSNIKSGVSILGVDGNVIELKGQTKEATPTTSQQLIRPDVDYNGLTLVTLAPIETENKTVKSTTSSQTITPTAGKFIDEVTVDPIVLEDITITPTTSAQTIIPSQNKDGINTITVNAIQTEQKIVKSTTSSQTITPTSGKYIDEITVTPIDLETKTVTPSTSQQIINPSTGKDGISTVIVEPVEDESTVLDNQDTILNNQSTTIEQIEQALSNKIAMDLAEATSDANATANDIATGKTAYVNGTKLIGNYSPQPNLQNKSVTITENGTTTVTADSGYDGLDEVEVTTNVPQPSGTINITENGTVDVSNYANANVNVSSGGDNNTKIDTNITNGALTRYIVTLPALSFGNRTDISNLCSAYKSLTSVGLFDTSRVTSMQYLFSGCERLETVPLFNTSSVISTQGMFQSCTRLNSVPLFDLSSNQYMSDMFSLCNALRSIPQFNTSHVVSMNNTFQYCSYLATVPQLDISSVTSMNNIFLNCSSLSNESLNNILAMCINATSYAGTKTLRQLGLSSSQATTCQTLSNYSDFITAGWTTGY